MTGRHRWRSLADGVRLTAAPHPLAGLQKRIEFHLHPDRPAVDVQHWIENQGPGPLELAPWSIASCRPAGSRRSHSGWSRSAASAAAEPGADPVAGE